MLRRPCRARQHGLASRHHCLDICFTATERTMATERYFYRKAASDLEELSDKYTELAKLKDTAESETHWIWAAAMRAAASHLRETSKHRVQGRDEKQTRVDRAIEKQLSEIESDT